MNWILEVVDGSGRAEIVQGTDVNEVFHRALRKKSRWARKLADDKDFVRQLVNGLTDKLQQRTKSLQDILANVIKCGSGVDWEAWKEKGEFTETKPEEPSFLPIVTKLGKSAEPFSPERPPRPELVGMPREPLRTDKIFQNATSIVERVKSKLDPHFFDAKFKLAHEDWNSRKRNLEEINSKLVEQHQELLAIWKENCNRLREYQDRLLRWNEMKAAFYQAQKDENKSVDELRANLHNSKSSELLRFFFRKVLEKTNHSIEYRRKVDIEYKAEQKLLLVDYLMPSIEDLPHHKELKYIQARDEIVEVFISDKQLNELYDEAMYQIALSCLHQMYATDEFGALDIIVFNGWAQSVDRRTGQDTNSCILSIQVSANEFKSINLSKVEPKACFKALKGIGSSKLHSITPVAPVMRMSREDKRFVEAYAVVDGLNNADNLAAMDWLDFENLIRELFEKEFSVNGGEVKITQASRDGGVDAIAFDPDPIRGGKMVIQAKRYTNVVGVSAVRDLYGTLINEGATKGILVTTSEYGPDAYEFAKGKPLALLSGGNLLALLEKHGHRAKIDLAEAKRILGEREK